MPNGPSSEEASYLRNNGQTEDATNSNAQKNGPLLDWYVEGPGRRVGYDDLTAIDWIFEYTKERQRKRLLYASGQGILGHLRQLLDASYVWIVLIATGVAVGILAASIDIATNWLGDIKTGYCKQGQGGGKFYLNRGFCCWGHEGVIAPTRNSCVSNQTNGLPVDSSECLDWTPWRKAFSIQSSGGGYMAEYTLFVIFSVRKFRTISRLCSSVIQAIFAVSASFLVRSYAIYARHSGIPEIKTVLGGFVIRHFMGPWTLAIKSLGLVRGLRLMISISCTDFFAVPCRCVRDVVRQGGSACTCCLLLRQSYHAAIRKSASQ